MEKVIFVADIFAPFSAKSSTQLVIYSLLFAIKQKHPDMLFVGLYREEQERFLIESFLSNESIDFVLIKSKIDMEKVNKFSTIFALYKAVSQNHKREFKLKTLNYFNGNVKIIVSVPSLESFAVANYLRKKMHSNEMKTVWTDVIALNSLNDFKNIPFGRKMLKPIEKRILKKSRLSFFLGEQQFKVMSSFYKKLSKKMDYYYPSNYPYFSYLNKDFKNITKNDNALYFGDLNPLVRDVYPLYLSSKYTDTHIKIVGKGRISVENFEITYTEYVPLDRRISVLSEALKIEKSSYISVCVLNKCGFSLPGKMFYYANIERPILVIKDGPFADEIESQLKPFNRFFFCDNTPTDIAAALDLIRKEENIDLNYCAFDPIRVYANIIK